MGELSGVDAGVWLWKEAVRGYRVERNLQGLQKSPVIVAQVCASLVIDICDPTFWRGLLFLFKKDNSRTITHALSGKLPFLLI